MSFIYFQDILMQYFMQKLTFKTKLKIYIFSTKFSKYLHNVNLETAFLSLV